MQNVEDESAETTRFSESYQPSLHRVPRHVRVLVTAITIIVCLIGTFLTYVKLFSRHERTFTSSALIDLRPALDQAAEAGSGLRGMDVMNSFVPELLEVMEASKSTFLKSSFHSDDSGPHKIKYGKEKSGSQYRIVVSCGDSMLARDFVREVIQLTGEKLSHAHNQSALDEAILELRKGREEAHATILPAAKEYAKKLNDDPHNTITKALMQFSMSMGEDAASYAYLADELKFTDAGVADELLKYAKALEKQNAPFHLSRSTQFKVEDKRLLYLSNLVAIFPRLHADKAKYEKLLEEEMTKLDHALQILNKTPLRNFVNVIEEPEVAGSLDPFPFYLSAESLKIYLGLSVVVAFMLSRLLQRGLLRWRYANLSSEVADVTKPISNQVSSSECNF